MKTAIQFGAGNIGRGFIGYLLSKSNYHVIFADVIVDIIDAINTNGKYNVEIVGEHSEVETISNISGILSTSEELINEISKASVITTAVGPKVLDIIARTIAEGIKLRYASGNTQFLNIIACENMMEGSHYLKLQVIIYLNDYEKEFLEKYIGFPNCAVDRIIPPFEGERSNLADVRVEQFSEWIVDDKEIKGVLEIHGMEHTDKLSAYLERKLFTLNTGHAITAYIGYSMGYKTIKESIEDQSIEKIVKNAMIESGNVLITEYSFDPKLHRQYIDKIISRFKNPYLIDEVTRVGRDPLRKLGYSDTFIKPYRMALYIGLPYENLLTGIVYALKYDYTGDPDVTIIDGMMKEFSLE